MGVINLIMFFAILGGLFFLLRRYTKFIAASDAESGEKTSFIKSLLPEHNPLKSLVHQSQNIKSPIYLTPDNIAVRILDFRRAEGYWHMWVNVFNMSNANSLIKIESITTEWKRSSKTEKCTHSLQKLTDGESFTFYAKFKHNERKIPKQITLTLKDGYGKEYILVSESNNDSGEQVMS